MFQIFQTGKWNKNKVFLKARLIRNVSKKICKKVAEISKSENKLTTCDVSGKCVDILD